MDEIIENKILEIVLNSTQKGIFILDTYKNVILANDPALDILGYNDKSELLGKDFHFLVHKSLETEDECIVCKSQIDGKIYRNLCTKYLKKDGNTILAQIQVYPFKINNDSKYCTMLVFEEITDSNLAILNFPFIVKMIEQSKTGFVITDLDGNIEYINDGYCEITGYEKSELLGQNPRILKSGKLNREFYKKLWDTITSGNTFADTLINKKKNGEIYYEDGIIFPLKDDNNQTIKYAAIKIDITKEKQLEETLFKMQKLETVGQLATGVAHDFNNILTGFNAYLEVLQYQIQNENSSHILDKLKQLSDKAATLVSHLLGYSRQQIIIPEIQRFSSLINDNLKMIRRVIPENINLTFEILSHDECMINIDKTQFNQIIMNLIINSRDALEVVEKENKTIKITLDNVDGVTYSHLSYVKDGNYMKLSVEDNGIGIKKEHLLKVFEPFFTTKDVGKGIGLGLASVYGIVKQNGGYIFADSVEGEYTRIDILWPCAKNEDEAKKQIETTKSPSMHDLAGSESILIAEDEEGLLTLLVNFFESNGYKVFKATNGKEGLEIIKNNKIDAVITDYDMPELNGDKMILEALKINKNLKCIITTGYKIKDEFKRLQSLCEIEFMEKPYRPIQMLKIIRNMLDKK